MCIRDRVGIAWIGFDKPRNMGRGETGGAAALPIWIKYMAVALNGVPEMAMRMPEGVVAINIDPATGTRSSSGILEYFYHENPPPTYEAVSYTHLIMDAPISTIITVCSRPELGSWLATKLYAASVA